MSQIARLHFGVTERANGWMGSKRVTQPVRLSYHEFLVGSVPLGLRLGERRPRRRQGATAAAGVATVVASSGIETHDERDVGAAGLGAGEVESPPVLCGDGGEDDLKYTQVRL